MRFGFTAYEAWDALESLCAATTVIGLAPARTIQTIGEQADDGSFGAWIYASLLVGTAEAHGIYAIITWDTRTLLGLSPGEPIMTPTEFLDRFGR